jgi:hypothetical protein
MNRRAFVSTYAVAILLAPVAAGGQPPAPVARIGVLAFSTPSDPYVEAFRRNLRDLGYTEGQTIAIEYRFAEGKAQRLPDLAAELVGLKVDVIFAIGTDVTVAVAKATSSIPIVGIISGDPVRVGLAVSLPRPGKNVTGGDPARGGVGGETAAAAQGGGSSGDSDRRALESRPSRRGIRADARRSTDAGRSASIPGGSKFRRLRERVSGGHQRACRSPPRRTEQAHLRTPAAHR